MNANMVDVAIQALGLSRQEHLAERLGVVKTAPSNWRQANRIPERQRFRLIAILREEGREIPDALFS